MDIQMVDLKSQYHKIKIEIDRAVLSCIDSTNYIKGPEVHNFESNLSNYLNTDHVITCGNGTDALQIALMAIGLKPGDEVIVPAFTYVATAEVIALLNLTPVMVDVDFESFNININQIEGSITSKTKAIVPVHLYGQSANMDDIMKIAERYNLYVIEDNAQSLGASFIYPDGNSLKTGTIGHIGCHSFFPTKNLGCFGDGGAITTNDPILADRCRMISSHGQKKKYFHEIVGCNSRLDSLQAAVLNVKLKYLDQYIDARQKAAKYYKHFLSGIELLDLPGNMDYSIHSYNQFTIKVKNGKRNGLQEFLKEKGIPTVIYYPIPLYNQPAFAEHNQNGKLLKTTEELCSTVLSIPMHTELTHKIQDYICECIINYSNAN